MSTQIKRIVEKRKDDIMQDRERIYYNLLELVEQALHARMITDAMWKYRWERVARTGIFNTIVSFCHVALENFTVLQLWKLFDRKNSVFHVWYVVEHLGKPTLVAWLNNKIAGIQEDIKLIDEWRHIAIGHRSEVGYFAPDESQRKFTTARLSEKHLHDFLLEFLCQIKFELQGISVAETMEGLQMGMTGFEYHVKSEMKKIFQDYDDKK